MRISQVEYPKVQIGFWQVGLADRVICNPATVEQVRLTPFGGQILEPDPSAPKHFLTETGLGYRFLPSSLL